MQAAQVLYGCGTAANSGSQEPIPGNGNADTVDGYHASNAPAPNTILVLNDEAKLPADITGNANTLDGHDSNDFLLRSIYDKNGDGKIDSDAITTGQIPWSSITGMLAGFADGVDNDTTYSAGTGLNLTGTTFSVDQTTLDTWYVNEEQIASISSSMISDGTIVDDEISASAGIDPSKINGTAWTSLNDGSGSGLDADLLDGYDSSYFLDTSATDQTKAGGLYVNFLASVTAVWADYFNIDSSSITIDSDGTNMQFNDNARTKVYTLSELAGWQGFSNRIKILPGDFTSTENGNTIALSANGAYAFDRVNAAADFIATYNIPNGFRATEVMVYGNNTLPLTVYECQINTNTCKTVSVGCAVGTLCNIIDVNSTDTNYLSIYINSDGAASYQIYGGYITISRY
jgi:hypothetical protein